jgi:hypothetical protein
MSELQRPQRPDRRKGSWVSICFIVIVATGFISFLALAPIGRIGLAFMVGGLVFPVIIGLHYFTWGRLMTRMLENENREETPAKGD